MFKNTDKVLIAYLAVSLAGAAHCSAKVSPEQLQVEISKANILGSDAKITCVVNDSELTATTYKVDVANEKDCKIDAVLIAKRAFESDPELTRATVLFYDIRIPNTYYEVAVTLGDVAAYGAGKVSKEQLVSALKLTMRTAAPAPDSTGAQPSSKNGASDAQTPQTTTSSDSQPSGTGEPPTPPTTIASITPAAASSAKASAKSNSATPPSASTAGKTTYSNYGVTFSYPNQWQPQYPRGGNTLVRFIVPGRGGVTSMVEMHVYAQKAMTPADIANDDPRETFEEDRNKMWIRATPEAFRSTVISHEQAWQDEKAKSEHFFMNKGEPSAFKSWLFNRRNQWSQLVAVALPASINIGQDTSIHCQQRGQWIVEPGMRNFARVVAFNGSGCTIMLGLFSHETNASGATMQFEDLLSTVKLSSTPAAKKHSPAKKG